MGFKKADKIAQEFGITGTDSRRLQAGILYVLATLTKEGHLFLTLDDLERKAWEMLQLQEEFEMKPILQQLEAEKRIVIRNWNEDDLIYLPNSFRSEEGSVHLLKPFLSERTAPIRETIVGALQSAFDEHGLKLSEIQQLAVETSLKKGFLIITGGPGTGKTTTLKAVVAAHKKLGKNVLLASPTGRAAKRLSEVSGFAASTIHRLLEFSPQEKGFKKKAGNPLDCDTLIVDEASMIDMNLFYSLIQAIPSHATVILVGDSDQLPSVGPGLVLKHLIISGVIPVVKLATIFRQAETSMIIKNAHAINSGKMPHLPIPDGKTKTDCYYVRAEEPERVIALLKNIVCKSLPARFQLDPLKDIQVLTPMNRGKLGASNLNIILQESLNPSSEDKPEIEHLSRVFRKGDKVIQLKNNYDLEVFNGDVGFISEINTEDQEATIEFPQGPIIFQNSDLLDLAHAYAVTVHKSQGSEYPAVVLLASTQHYMMLQRNLIYTGLTRAKKTMVLLGSKRAIAIGVGNNKVIARNTIFRQLLEKKYSKKMES